MHYQNVRAAKFIDRPNRFIAHVELDGSVETVHVKNTGRCRELLVPGCTVYLEKGTNPNRKTAYDLIAVEKGSSLINMDAQAPNKVFAEWAAAGGFLSDVTAIRPEYTYGGSRLDFCVETEGRLHLVEVKGVTLEENGNALFPDAPTERGVKHIRELQRAAETGLDAVLFFVVQIRDIHSVAPNDATHPAFGEALREAAAHGVRVLAYDCDVTVPHRRGTVDGRLRCGDLSGPVHDEDQMGPCLDGGIVFRRLSGIDAPSGVGTWLAIFRIYPAV